MCLWVDFRDNCDLRDIRVGGLKFFFSSKPSVASNLKSRPSIFHEFYFKPRSLCPTVPHLFSSVPFDTVKEPPFLPTILFRVTGSRRWKNQSFVRVCAPKKENSLGESCTRVRYTHFSYPLFALFLSRVVKLLS